jgi:hypothetical protein
VINMRAANAATSAPANPACARYCRQVTQLIPMRPFCERPCT